MSKPVRWSFAVVIPIAGACAPRHAGITPRPVEATARASSRPTESPMPGRASDPAADPIGYLREAQRRAVALQQYQVTFVRQERLGAIPTLHAVERINVRFRAVPFSVKFEWQGNDSEFREAAY